MTGLGAGLVRPDAWPEIQPAVLVYAPTTGWPRALFSRCGVGPAPWPTPCCWSPPARGLLIPALALAGAPFTSGAVAKVALKSNLVFLPEGWGSVLSAAAGRCGDDAHDGPVPWLTWPRRAPAARGIHRGVVATLALPGGRGAGWGYGCCPARWVCCRPSSRRRSSGWRPGRCSSAADWRRSARGCGDGSPVTRRAGCPRATWAFCWRSSWRALARERRPAPRPITDTSMARAPQPGARAATPAQPRSECASAQSSGG